MPEYVRDAGVWKESKPWVRDAGVWKEVKEAFVKDAGIWKPYYASGPDIGDAWEGGYYFGTIVDGGSTYALVVSDYTDGQTKLRGKTTANASSAASSFTNGAANTAAIANTTHPAANFCANLISGGFDDWYLPAIDELEILHNARTLLPAGQAMAASDKTLSSTNSSSLYWWGMNLNTGARINIVKDDNSDLRAIRRVLL